LSLTKSYYFRKACSEIREITIGGLLREITDAHAVSVAMMYIDDNGRSGHEWTYAELLTRAEQLASALSTRYIPGERVVVWAPNIPKWFFMEYGCALAGVVLEQSGAVGLFLVNGFRGNPMADIAREAISKNKRLREVVNLEDAIALYATGGQSVLLPDVHPNDAAQIQYTSGTTGFPKGAVLSHKSLLSNARLFCERKQVGLHSVWDNFMPMFHTAGCATGALGCLQAACKMLLIKRFDANMLACLIEKHRVTTFFAVPSMLFGLLEALDQTPRDMSSLEVITTGGAPMLPDLVRRVRERLGCHLLSAFGQTEHSPMICLNPVEATLEQIVETADQRLPQTEVSVHSPDHNGVLPIDEVGEICARSYAVMKCYNDNPEATATTIDEEGWLHTRDLSTMDPQGFVRVTGRVKGMIIRGGENYFQAEIEAAIITHPDVVQVAVVGLPDEKWREVIATFILCEMVTDLAGLRDHCKNLLSAQKTPSVWVHLPDFPLTGSGKVQKFAIRERFIAGNYGEILS
jgi:fatty-acyl-CoA synthase